KVSPSTTPANAPCTWWSISCSSSSASASRSASPSLPTGSDRPGEPEPLHQVSHLRSGRNLDLVAPHRQQWLQQRRPQVVPCQLRSLQGVQCLGLRAPDRNDPGLGQLSLG